MRKSNRHGLWSTPIKVNAGFSMVEMLVVMALVAILAVVTLPYSQLTHKRSQEIQLKTALRTIRTAITTFHEDVIDAKISTQDEGVSQNGYPKTLEVLVMGVDAGGTVDKKIKYLRRIPKDPFGDAKQEASEHWALRSYDDEPDALGWGAQDVYDVTSRSEKKAIDGTLYKDW